MTGKKGPAPRVAAEAAATKLLADLARAAAARRKHELEDRAALAALLLKAREHPDVNMNDAAKAARVSRVGAYELARAAEPDTATDG